MRLETFETLNLFWIHILFQACSAWCEETPNCQAWTRHQRTGLCNLKSTTRGRKGYHPAWTWGTKCGSVSDDHYDYFETYNSYQDYFPKEDDYENCIQDCPPTKPQPHNQNASGCETTKGTACVFPFIYKGVKYSGCTTEDYGETPWCSTKTDKDGNYVDHAYFGICAQKCPLSSECKAHTGITCIFPFIYRGVKYSGCTTVDNGEVPWCSTVTDKDGNYIDHPSNFHTWGNCGQNCSLSNPITTTSTTTNTSRCKTQRGSPCAFPFIYKGVKYSGCTKVDNGPVQVPWCSTVTDKYGNYIEHPTKLLTWGYCGQDCPSSPHSNENQVNLQVCQVFAGQYLGAGDDVVKAFHANTNEVENFKNFNLGSFFDLGMFILVSEESKLSRMDKTSDNWTL